MAAHDHMGNAQPVDGILQRAETVEVAGHHQVGDVSVHEELARWAVDDQAGGDAAVRASDPEDAGLLERGQSAEEARIALLGPVGPCTVARQEGGELWVRGSWRVRVQVGWGIGHEIPVQVGRGWTSTVAVSAGGGERRRCALRRPPRGPWARPDREGNLSDGTLALRPASGRVASRASRRPRTCPTTMPPSIARGARARRAHVAARVGHAHHGAGLPRRSEGNAHLLQRAGGDPARPTLRRRGRVAGLSPRRDLHHDHRSSASTRFIGLRIRLGGM